MGKVSALLDRAVEWAYGNVYDWPDPARHFYARWWLLLALPRGLLCALIILFVILPWGIYAGIKDHADKIRSGQR